MEIYEFSTRRKVSFTEVVSIISNFKNISVEKIGQQKDYFNLLSTPNELEIGISISHQTKGYKSFIVLTITDDITDLEFVKIACQIAKTLKTDVAIGDVTSTSEFSIGQYLIITANQKYLKAYEESNDGELFELSPYTEEADITELLNTVGK